MANMICVLILSLLTEHSNTMHQLKRFLLAVNAPHNNCLINRYFPREHTTGQNDDDAAVQLVMAK
jgi:hypothetical protein